MIHPTGFYGILLLFSLITFLKHETIFVYVLKGQRVFRRKKTCKYLEMERVWQHVKWKKSRVCWVCECAIWLGWAGLCDWVAATGPQHCSFPRHFVPQYILSCFWNWQFSNSSGLANQCHVVFGRREVRGVAGLWVAGKKNVHFENPPIHLLV